jgi:hypothetical protein
MAGGGFNPPFSLQRRFRRLPEDTSFLISAKDWASEHSYAPVTVIQTIRKGKLRGYKSGGRWWVDTRYSKLEDGSKYP